MFKKNGMTDLPNPMEIVDAVGDAALEVFRFPIRVARNIASTAQNYAAKADSDVSRVEKEMPGNPMVIPETAVSAAKNTIDAGVGFVKSFGSAFDQTRGGVDAQIRRIIK